MIVEGKVGEAKVDSIFQGKGSGGVASKLLANGMDTSRLRTNDTLGYDDWKKIDDSVLMIAQRRMVGVNDLVSRGLVYDMGGAGLGKTVLGYQDASDINDAQVSMDAVNRGAKDRQEFDINYLPLPIVHCDFSFSVREINMAREGRIPLDTTMAEAAARKVSEKVEQILFQGNNAFTFGGGTIRGYQDHPNRNTVTLSTNWDGSGATGAGILDDVLSMIQASINDRHYGPWGLYIPTAYQRVLGEDYSSNYQLSIRDRLNQIEGLEFIRVADFLSANNVVLVSLNSESVRMVVGLPIRTVQWETEGGFQLNFKILTIMVPQIRADQAGRSGIIHLS